MHLKFFMTAFLFCCATAAIAEEPRDWKDLAGKRTISAKAKEAVIQLERPDGKLIELKWDMLSKEDQEWVLEWLRSKMRDDPAADPKATKALTPDEALLALRRAGVEVANGGTMVLLKDDTISAKEIANIRFLPKLNEIMIFSEKPDDRLAAIGELPTLTKISIRRNLSNAGLRLLSKYKNLTFIYIDSEKVTDAGLTHLHSLKKLEDLRLEHTKVTKTAIEKLYVELPKCVVKKE